MSIPEAKRYVGKKCWLTWTDRFGQWHGKVLRVQAVRFLSMYGSYIIGDGEEIRLERVAEIYAVE